MHPLQTAAVFRLRRSGAIQQPGRELDAARSTRTQELAACGQRTDLPPLFLLVITRETRVLCWRKSCRRLGVPVNEYFAAVLPGSNRRTLSQVSNLTPARWSAGRD